MNYKFPFKFGLKPSISLTLAYHGLKPVVSNLPCELDFSPNQQVDNTIFLIISNNNAGLYHP
jgi:hypothetical protein